MDSSSDCEVKQFDYNNVKNLCLKLSKRECCEWIDNLKSNSDRITAKDPDSASAKREYFYYMLNLMTLYLIKFVNIDTRQVEDIFIKLVRSEWTEDDNESFPFEYKIEFIVLLGTVFNDNGFFSKSEEAIKRLYQIYESHIDNTFVAFKYIILYLSRGYDIWSIYAQTPEEYVKGINEVLDRHQFSKDQLLDIEFKKNRIFCDYCSICKLSEGIKYHKKIMEITQENQSLFHLCECCDLLLCYCAKMPEELDANIPIFESMIDECLRESEDKEHNFTYLHFNLLKIFRAVKLKDKIDQSTWTASKLFNEVIEIMRIHEMNQYATLNFEIIISLLLFSLDPDIINQGRLIEMRRKFTDMVSIVEDESTRYKVSYTLINIFGLVVQIQQAMGVQVDSKLPLKYEKGYEGEKLSYISFFSSLEALQDPEIVPCIKKALEYCDEYKIQRFQKMRLNLEIQLIMSGLYSVSNVDQINSKANLESLICELDQIKDNELIEQKILVLYFTYMVYLERTNDLLKFIDIAEKYLILGVKFYENIEFMCGTFQKLINNGTNVLLGTQNLQKANEIAEKQLIFTEGLGKNTKSYADALYYVFITKRAVGDINFLLMNSNNLLEATKSSYGEKTPQYIQAIKEMAYSKMYAYQTNEAYKYWLKAYDLSKETYESEVNEMSTGILLEMAAIKSSMAQFEDAINLCDKAKKIEEQLSSIYSNKYKAISSLEKLIKETQKKYEDEHKVKESFFRKLLPNNKFKIAIYSIGIAAIGLGETKIKEGISGIEYFSCEDQSDGCGAKFLCIIVSSEFNDMKLLDRQRKVNDILSKEISEIHAFELKTWTPKQWESKKVEFTS